MEIVQPTFGRTFRVWWSITWRALAYGIGLGVVASILIGVVINFAGGSQQDVVEFSRISGFFTGAAGSLYAAYSRLGKRCGDVKLVLIRAHNEE